jgi:hypothetical protein
MIFTKAQLLLLPLILLLLVYHILIYFVPLNVQTKKLPSRELAPAGRPCPANVIIIAAGFWLGLPMLVLSFMIFLLPESRKYRSWEPAECQTGFGESSS